MITIKPATDARKACFACGNPAEIEIPSRNGIISVSFCAMCRTAIAPTLPARPAAEIGGTEVAMWRAGELLIEACDLGIAIHDQLGLLDYRVDYGTAAAQRKRLQAIRDGEAAARPQPAAEIEIDRSPIISAAETYGRALAARRDSRDFDRFYAALLEHEEEVRALATPAPVPADLRALLVEHADADAAYRNAEAAGLSAQLLVPFARKAEDLSFALAEWTRANLPEKETTDADPR